MTETGWQAIGRIAKERRERLGLRQDELAQYGGPRVSTVGKFERGAQSHFPLRTQHQIENALGWPRTTIEQFVDSVENGRLTIDDWEHDLIHEGVPDMSSSRPTTADIERVTGDPLAVLGYVFRLIPVERQDEAAKAALHAMLRFLRAPDQADLHQSDLDLAAHDEEVSISQEQAQTGEA